MIIYGYGADLEELFPDAMPVGRQHMNESPGIDFIFENFYGYSIMSVESRAHFCEFLPCISLLV